MIAVLALGLVTVVSAMGWLFKVLRLVGAAYLIWPAPASWPPPTRLNPGAPGVVHCRLGSPPGA